MRTMQITYARLVLPLHTEFNPETGNGSITAQYVVGADVPAVEHPDGSIVGPLEIDLPPATLGGMARVSLDASHTVAEKYEELLQAILDAERLSVEDGDRVYDTSGVRLI